MSPRRRDGVSLQNAEFDAVVELCKQYRRISVVAPVDDDYPEVRHDYDAALNDLLDAAKANNRRMP